MIDDGETQPKNPPLELVPPVVERLRRDDVPTECLTRARVVARNWRTGRRRRLALPLAALFLACSSPPPMPMVDTVNGCDTAKYVDRAEASAERKVGFGGALGSGAVLKGLIKRIAETIAITTIGEPHEVEAFTP